MKILVLTQWYPPEPALLLQELAQSLLEMGHEVQVLTGFPNYPTGVIYPGYKLRWQKREVLAGIPVTRVILYPAHGTSKFKRILNYFSFSISSAFLGPFLINRPDVIFSYHPPLTVGFSAFLLSRLWRVPFVYQIQDMWPETLAATGMLGNRKILSMVGYFAKWVYRYAKKILVISPGFKKNLIEKGVPAEKIHMISNWVDTNLYYPEEPDLDLAKNLGLAGKFNVMFAGNLGKAQGLETVLEAGEILANHANIQFVFVGDGVELPMLKALAIEKKLTNVLFLGRFPAKEMSRLYALADVLLVHLKDSPLFQITIPHKIMAYLAVGKPVIAALSGDGADVIREAGVGFAIPPENAQAMANAVISFFEMSPKERASLGIRARKIAISQFGRQTLTAQIETVLQLAVNKNGSI